MKFNFGQTPHHIKPDKIAQYYQNLYLEFIEEHSFG